MSLRRVFALLVAVLSFAPAGAAHRSAPPPGPEPRVVVAVIDSPANPYHEAYHAGGSIYGDTKPSSVTPQVLAEFGIDPQHIIRLTRTGDFEKDFARDRAQFDAIERGEPYWFEGTNVIGISFNDEPGRRLRPDGNGSTHGVGTTTAVLTANPEATVVSVEAPNGPFGVPGFGTIPLGEAWAFRHPAVDFISTSYGPPFSPPFGYHLEDSYLGVVGNGKVHVGASDNSPALSPVDATSGPWWTIGVAGFGEDGTEGRVVRSGSLPDVVADWTQTLPYCRNCEEGTRTVNGTSFATPRTAGTMSQVLLEARRAAGHRGGIVTEGVEQPLMVRSETLNITNWQLRRAVEDAAYYPTTAEYKAGGTSEVPVLDAAPWAQTGWGVVTPDPAHGVVAEALARLGVAGEPSRTKPAAACDFMTANIEARHAYWDEIAFYSESAGADEDPFVYC
jgi:hypothetical protein